MPTALIAAFSPSADGAATPVSPFGMEPGATGPPGGSSLAALFASLLAGTYAPPAAPVSAQPISALPISALPVSALPGSNVPAAQLPSLLLTSVGAAVAETDILGGAEKTGGAEKKTVSKTNKETPDTVPLPTPALLTPILVSPPSPLVVSAKAADTIKASRTKTDITLEKPMDTAPALMPHGESLLPAIAPAPVAPAQFGQTQVGQTQVVQGTAQMIALLNPGVPKATVTSGVPLPLPSAAPPVDALAANIPAANIPALQTPTADTRAVALPNVAQAVTGVGDGSRPSLLPSNKTPQKDLKITAGRADTNTSTQMELPRLTSLSRNPLPTDGTLTDGTLTDEHPTEELHMEERRMDAGQGQAALPAATPLLHTGAAAAAGTAPETKVLTHTEKLAIVQQLADGAGGMRLSVKPGAAQEMTVQLHPKDWGSLHVTVQIAPGTDVQVVDPAHGDAPKDAAPRTVTAHIVAETPQVKAALESHTGDLHQKLREAGLHLDSVTVTVRVPDAGKLSGTTPQGSSHGGTWGQAGTPQGSDFGQRLADTGRPEGSLGSSAGPALSGDGASGSQNNSSGGRQGSQTPPQNLHWTGSEPDADAAPLWTASRHSGAVRLDLRA